MPLKGVQVSAHDTTAVFVLRNLPAGELTVSVVPVATLPQDLVVPAGRVRMPTGPIQIEDATIVIDNPRLLRYLVGPSVASAP